MDTNKKVRMIDLIAVISMGSFAFLLYSSFSLVSEGMNKKKIIRILQTDYEINYMEDSNIRSELENNLFYFNEKVDINFNKKKEEKIWINSNYKDESGTFEDSLVEKDYMSESQLRGLNLIFKRGRRINIYLAPFGIKDKNYILDKWGIYIDGKLVYSNKFQLDENNISSTRIEAFEYVLNDYREVSVTVVYTILKNGKTYYLKEK